VSSNESSALPSFFFGFCYSFQISTLNPAEVARSPGEFPVVSPLYGAQNDISSVIIPFSSCAYTVSNFFQYLPSWECLKDL
jgi:hypothetical protein